MHPSYDPPPENSMKRITGKRVPHTMTHAQISKHRKKHRPTPHQLEHVQQLCERCIQACKCGGHPSLPLNRLISAILHQKASRDLGETDTQENRSCVSHCMPCGAFRQEGLRSKSTRDHLALNSTSYNIHRNKTMLWCPLPALLVSCLPAVWCPCSTCLLLAACCPTEHCACCLAACCPAEHCLLPVLRAAYYPVALFSWCPCPAALLPYCVLPAIFCPC
jgi:hypothetical protein